MKKEKMILTSLGKDDWGNLVYKNSEGEFFKGIVEPSGEQVLCTCGSFCGEPDTPIKALEKYKGLTIEIDVSEEIEREDEGVRFRYMMLSRLKQDCDYYLGNGDREKKHLWAADEAEQIAKMKNLYNSFKDDDKPEWLSYQEILEYEKKMLNC